MALEARDQVEQFFTLYQKEEDELKAICEGLGLPTGGTKHDLIRNIVGEDYLTQQTDVAIPQLISLTTKNSNSVDVFRRWRKMIFDGKTNTREFLLISKTGKHYTQQMKYIGLTPGAAQKLLKMNWHFNDGSQRDLINLILEEPTRFNFMIVRKPSRNGKTFLMLYCEPKAA